MIQLDMIVDLLREDYSIFHNEYDFGRALIQVLFNTYPDCRIYSECTPQPHDREERLDICIILDEMEHLIELKYKTNRFDVQIEGTDYSLGKNPVDLACYDYLRDIERLERVVSRREKSLGSSMLLSNKSLLWRGPPRTGAQYYPFRLEEGRKIQGELDWTGNRERKGRSRQNPIAIRNSYELHWADYSDLSEKGMPAKNGVFRYLLVHVT